MASLSLFICWLSISTTSIVVIIDRVEVECSAIVFYSNERADLRVSFGCQGMIQKMDDMVIGLKNQESIITFVLFYHVPGVCVCVMIPPNDSDVTRFDGSRVQGELPEHLLYFTVNSLSV